MLNKDNVRELVYLVRVDRIEPIPGRDRVESAIVGGWSIMVRKDQFKEGTIGVYFEIDSKTPEKEPFEFLAQKHYKIKTQKYKTPEGQYWSQGLLMGLEDFGWKAIEGGCIDSSGAKHLVDDETRFLTQTLGVIYADADDNQRKSNGVDKYKKMGARHPKLFKKKPIRWLMRRSWGRKLLFLFFGRPKDKKNQWPVWVHKTDEERIQCELWRLKDKRPWVATEKIDGTSTTFTIRRKSFGRYDFYVCSRNVVFDKPDKQCFYDTNVYQEMARKYNIESVLKSLLDKFGCEWVTLQGETYGAGIQRRDYSKTDHDFAGFNFITSDTGRWNSVEAKELFEPYGIPWVPIVDTKFILPDTIDELLEIATDKSEIDGGMREGLVFRSQDGAESFKAVSNEFLIKYHC